MLLMFENGIILQAVHAAQTTGTWENVRMLTRKVAISKT